MMLRMYRKLFVKSWIGMMVLFVMATGSTHARPRGGAAIIKPGDTLWFDNGSSYTVDTDGTIPLDPEGKNRLPVKNHTADWVKNQLRHRTVKLQKAQSNQKIGGESVAVESGHPKISIPGGAPAAPEASSDETTTAAAPAAPSGGPGYIDERSRVRTTADDECEYSATYDGGWKCNFTNGAVTGAKVTHQVTQLAGTAMVQISGQQEAAKAAQSGKMSESYDAGANIAQKTGQIELATGAINVGMGALLLYQGMQHSSKAKKAKKAAEIQAQDLVADPLTGVVSVRGGQAATATAQSPSGASSSDKMFGQMAQNFGINKQTGAQGEFEVGRFVPGVLGPQTPQNQAIQQAALQTRERHAARLIQDAAHNMAKEQSATATGATTQGMSSLITGAGQVIMGMTHQSMAKQMRKTSKDIKDIENNLPALPGGMPVLPPGNGLNPILPPGGIGAPVIIGQEQPTPNEEVSPAESADNKQLDEKPLPVGLDRPEFKGIPTTGPQLANGAGGPDSGSPMNVSGGGLQGLGNSNEGEAGAEGKLPNEADPRYAGGGGGAAYGAGGRGGGGGDGGPDLSKMLDKLMGSKDENFAQKPNIEEFGRAPASEPYSFLDKNVDIFQRVHQAYQAKAKAGRVILF